MEKNEKAWMIGGMIAIAGVSSLLYVPNMMNAIVPMPIHLVILAWTISHVFIAVLPTIYAALFGAFYRNRNYGKIILYISIAISALNIYYFIGSWEYGITWQGETHTRIVAAENAIGFIILILLASLGIKRNSKTLQHSAHLFLFLLLSWCAFPYLGEMP